MTADAAPELSYEPVVGWPLVPHGIFVHEATSVGVSADNRVYVFNRGRWPMLVFDTGGNFLDTWGAGEFMRPHGVSIDVEGNLWLTDTGLHTVQKRTPEGKLLLEIGNRCQPSGYHSGIPFNEPTQVAVHPRTGEIFVSDGYGNSAIHRFAPDGTLLRSWGEPGDGPGQFSLPHSICFLDDERVLVADRENFRLQVFTLDGEFLLEKHGHKPQALFAGVDGDPYIYLAEGRTIPRMDGTPRTGRRVRVLDGDLNEVTRIGNDAAGEMPNQFISPHGLAVDGEGSIYVAEVSFMALGSRLPQPEEIISIRKWRRAGASDSPGKMPESAIPRYVAGVRTDGPGAAPPI